MSETSFKFRGATVPLPTSTPAKQPQIVELSPGMQGLVTIGARLHEQARMADYHLFQGMKIVYNRAAKQTGLASPTPVHRTLDEVFSNQMRAGTLTVAMGAVLRSITAADEAGVPLSAEDIQTMERKALVGAYVAMHHILVLEAVWDSIPEDIQAEVTAQIEEEQGGSE